MGSWVRLAAFLVLVFGGGTLIGWATLPGEWYAGLVKPSFNPPNWLFGPVWSVLFVLIAIAGWRTFERDRDGHAMRLWWAQLAFNFAWPPIFFGFQSPIFALVVIAALLATIVFFILAVRRTDGLAALLFVPYALWVGFASLLNAAIVALN